MKRSLPLLLTACAAVVLGSIVTGCSSNAPEIPKDEFTKPHPMPPEAQKGMQEAMKRAQTKPPAATGH